MQPGHVYTLTTTTGQGKGTATGPAPGALSLPYSDTFDGYAAGTEAKYLMDMQGAFEAAACGGGRSRPVRAPDEPAGADHLGRAVRSARPARRRWAGATTPSRSDVLLEKSGYAELIGRASAQDYDQHRPG